METIKKGSKGIIVEYWQEFLKNLQLLNNRISKNKWFSCRWNSW